MIRKKMYFLLSEKSKNTMDMIPSVRIHIYICIYEMYMKRSEKINKNYSVFRKMSRFGQGREV